MNRRNLFKTALAATALLAVPTLAFATKPAVYTGIVKGVGAGGYDV